MMPRQIGLLPFRPRVPALLAVVLTLHLAGMRGRCADAFANFESPQARPLAISADGKTLYAVNTPASLLTVFSLDDSGRPTLKQRIPVGLDPVSVAIRARDEVWVVNHVSDSISVVKASRGAVVHTISVGDAPGDVTFAGDPRRAFVTSTTERAIRVIDPDSMRIVKVIPVFGDAPRSLLASADGRTVWVAVGRSGNRTTIAPHTVAPRPPPPTNRNLPPAPRQGLIVDSADPKWKRLDVKLPDYDVIEIDAGKLTVRRRYSGVGTILFNLTRRPRTNELWVANTQARNLTRFEPKLRGHAIDSRITRIATNGSSKVRIVDLNLGLNYGKLPNPSARSTALSQPTDVVFDPSGRIGYVASFGTDRIGVLDSKGRITARIDVGPSTGSKPDPRNKRGPRAMVHHPSRGRLYVLNRLSNTVSIVDTKRRKVIREIPLFDPTPHFVKQGRGFLFDARLSGNGTMSCAACHVDGDRDGLAWDLGDPGGALFSNGSEKLHPMKGPLLTQTLRGLRGERLFHWRGDRPGLRSFNVAFETLLGGDRLTEKDLGLLVRYLKTIRFAPNPNRNRDGSSPTTPKGTSAADGETIFRTKRNVGRNGVNRFRCVDCHINKSGSGSFGFRGLIDQPTKAVQLRGLYERNGRRRSKQGRVAGFGYSADGSKDDLTDFLAESHRFVKLNTGEKQALKRFLLSFPSETASIVGFSRTFDFSNTRRSANSKDLELLVTQAGRGNCDLIVKGVFDDRQIGFLYNPAKRRFLPDAAKKRPMTLSQLHNAAKNGKAVLTFMAVPPGSGRRLGIDRNLNGRLDGDER